MNRILVLNINDYNSGYGGQATFIKNLHPYLSEVSTLKYLVVPEFFTKHHIIPLRFIYFFQVMFFLLSNRNEFDLLISHTPEASFVSSLFKIPFIHIFHGNKNALTKSIFWYGKYFKWVFESFDKRIIKKAAKLYTVGEYRENAEKFCNPIDFHLTQFTEPAERKDFVFAGRLEVMKNIDSIIDIYNSLPVIYKTNNNLNIIGAGTQETALKKYVNKLNLNEKVLFHGQLTNEKAIEIISKSLILLMSSSHEGFPMVIAESLTVGTPVISTDVGDIRSVINNGYNGFLLPLGYDKSSYVEKIIELLTDYQRISTNAVKSSSVFNAKEIASKFISEFEGIINCNSNSRDKQ
jgi:glycosyltransferase involved in cell wall biosynthesis